MLDNFSQYCDYNAILRQMTCLDTPQQNEAAKGSVAILLYYAFHGRMTRIFLENFGQKLFNVHAMYLIGCLLGQVHKDLPLKLYMMRTQILIIFRYLVQFAMFIFLNLIKPNLTQKQGSMNLLAMTLVGRIEGAWIQKQRSQQCLEIWCLMQYHLYLVLQRLSLLMMIKPRWSFYSL